MAQPTKYISRPTPIEALRIPKAGDPNAFQDSIDLFQWVANSIGTFDALPVIEKTRKAPEWGISIDPRDGRVMLAQPKGVQWGNDGDWVCKSELGKFFFCPHNFFVGKYAEIKDN